MVESFIEANTKKLENEIEKVDVEAMLKQREKGEPFYNMLHSDDWKLIEETIKEDVYKGLSFTPADPKNDWWAKYSWGLKCFMERAKGYSDRYEEAIRELSK